MKLNVSFNYAKVYDFKSLDVAVGEKFIIEVEGVEPDFVWFFNNDSILNVNSLAEKAEFEALTEGESSILLVKNGQIIYSFPIKVSNPIKLNLEVLSVEAK